nr:uncharacterized protein LOC109186547 [Ipomoea batatas]
MTPFSVILSAVATVKLYFGRCFNIQDLTNLEDFSQDTFNRLAEIYSTVFLVSTFMTVGQFLQIEDELGGSSTLLALAGSLYALLVVPEHNELWIQTRESCHVLLWHALLYHTINGAPLPPPPRAPLPPLPTDHTVDGALPLSNRDRPTQLFKVNKVKYGIYVMRFTLDSPWPKVGHMKYIGPALLSLMVVFPSEKDCKAFAALQLS